MLLDSRSQKLKSVFRQEMGKYKEYSNFFKGRKISYTDECANLALLHQYGGRKKERNCPFY